jgi:hypothetical protein
VLITLGGAAYAVNFFRAYSAMERPASFAALRIARYSACVILWHKTFALRSAGCLRGLPMSSNCIQILGHLSSYFLLRSHSSTSGQEKRRKPSQRSTGSRWPLLRELSVCL